MILRPQAARILPSVPAMRPSAPMPLPQQPVRSGIALNLKIKQINIEGLNKSEQGVFLLAFNTRVSALAQAAGGDQLRARFLQSPHASRIRHIDGGMLPAGLDAKRIGERAATAIFRELLR